MRGSALFNKLWVIESLPSGDLKTGYNLVHGQLSQAQFTNEKLKIGYETPETKNDFFQVLKKIQKDTSENSNFPMIHIDCHGCPDGISAANRQIIKWEELRTNLININIACRLNLVIVLAACSGAHLIKVATKLDRAPFWAIVGPDENVTAGSIEKKFGAFYTVFFNKLNGNEAMTALNQGKNSQDRKYHFFSAIGLFIKAYNKYHQNHCVGKSKKERIEHLITEALKDPAVREKGIGWAREQIKSQIGNEEKYFCKYVENFFMIDLFGALGRYIADKSNYDYPVNDEQYMREYLCRINKR